MKNFKNLKDYIKNESGYVSIEAIFGLAVFLLFFLLFLSLLTYVYPQIQLQQDTKVLALICERQGGLTDENVNDFMESIQKYSFIADSSLSAIVTAESDNGINAIGVTPVGEVGNDYIKRDSLDVINLNIWIPSNSSFINKILKTFGVSRVGDYYHYYFSVMSERY